VVNFYHYKRMLQLEFYTKKVKKNMLCRVTTNEE
jgi:hypothetical protein